MKYIVFSLLTILLFSCNPSASNADSEVVKDSPVVNPNALIIKEKCAVILNHSTEEIEAMQKEYSEDDLAEIASDIGFYNMTANDDLTAKGIKVVSTDKEEIIFVQSNGEQTTIKRKDYEKDLIFFSPDQKPLGTFTTDFEEDLTYFGGSEASSGSEFVEGYWVDLKALGNAEEDHIFKYFYKTSLINDEPLLQVFDGGNIIVEEILIEQKDGIFKQGKEEAFYEFRDGKEITVTELGLIRGFIRIPEKRIKE